MPRLSNKEKYRREIFYLWIKNRKRHGSNHRITRKWRAVHEALAEERYMEPRVFVPKSDWARNILPKYSDIRWRSFARMSPESFRHILGLISNNPLFYNNANPQQTPIETQLKIALWRLGNDGSASGFRPSASQWGVSEGHINDCTRRVITALFQLREQYIKWPSATERRRESINNDEREGFLGAIGKADNTDIVLQCKPGGEFNDEAFWNKKKRYALDLCAMCDSSKKFIYMLTGFSNATHDARVWGHTRLHQDPETYFSEGQYLLGDSAYTNTEYMVTPYKAPHTRQKRIRKFNRRLSSIRIDIEHAFGILKGRWKSLTGLRLRLRTKKQYEFACMWITACVVLHNVLHGLDDTWSEEEGWEDIEEEEEHDNELLSLTPQQRTRGHNKREAVKIMVLGKVDF